MKAGTGGGGGGGVGKKPGPVERIACIGQEWVEHRVEKPPLLML